MAESGRILLADDEETFLFSTADLLRREGYICDTVPDANAAAKKLGEADYDLLISDMRMSGNLDMELVRSLPQIVRGLPIILVTGYPTLNSAVHSVSLPVIAYLTKPVDFEELLQHTRRGVRCRHAYRAIAATRTQLQGWYKDLEHMQTLLETSPGALADITVDTFLALTLRQAAGLLMGLKQLGDGTPLTTIPVLCQAPDCERYLAVRKTVDSAIDELDRLQKSMPSAQMQQLRDRLSKLSQR